VAISKEISRKVSGTQSRWASDHSSPSRTLGNDGHHTITRPSGRLIPTAIVNRDLEQISAQAASNIDLRAEHQGRDDLKSTILRETRQRNHTATRSAEGLGRFARKKRMRVAFGSAVNRRTPPQLTAKLEPEKGEECDKCTCELGKRHESHTRPKTAEASKEVELQPNNLKTESATAHKFFRPARFFRGGTEAQVGTTTSLRRSLPKTIS